MDLSHLCKSDRARQFEKQVKMSVSLVHRRVLYFVTLLGLVDWRIRHQYVRALPDPFISPGGEKSFVKSLSAASPLGGLDKSVGKQLGEEIAFNLPKSVQSHSRFSQRTTGSEAPANLQPGLNLRRRKGQHRDYFKKTVKLVRVRELECKSSYSMTPLHNPVSFSLNSSIYERKERLCRWNIIGTEQCIPLLTCKTEKLTESCDSEYLEIVDGVGGGMKICGGNKEEVSKLQATRDLRDLYLTYRVLKGKGGPKAAGSSKELFTCEVTCGKRGDGTPLENSFVRKENPKCFCGTKPNDDRIVNGEDSKKFQYPWLVALVETNTRQPFCGGSIINNRFIQTAAHCIKFKYTDYRRIQVIINGHVLDQSPNINMPLSEQLPTKTYPLEELEELDKKNGSRRYSLEEIIVHPLFVADSNDFDVALLKLSEDIDLNPKKLEVNMESILQQPRAICLPPLGSYLRTYSDKKAIIAGWGYPNLLANGTMKILQQLEVRVFSPKDCKGMYAHRVNRRMLCAGFQEGKRDSCAGDSGGPLLLEERPKVWTQIGILSFGEGCAEPKYPGVYYRTTEGVQWISYHSNYNAQRVNDKAEENRSATWCLTPP